MRVGWWPRAMLGWPGTSTASSSTVAQLRLARARGLGCTSGRPEARYGFLRKPRARLCAWIGQAGWLLTASFATAAASSGRGGNQDWGGGKDGGERGEGRGAHREPVEKLFVLGDSLDGANRRRRSRTSEVEDDGGEDDARLPAKHGSAWTKRRMWRISQTQRAVEGNGWLCERRR